MSSTPLSLRELFDAAVLLAPSKRRAFLDDTCADPALRARAEALLGSDADAGEPLSGRDPARLAHAIGLPEPLSSHLPPGSRIGPFELIEVLGEGGSSTVFRATRVIEGASQEVALKLMRRGLFGPAEQRLFRREQRALIQLRHPNIAHMIEGGVTETGLPYIALELVDGAPITEHARLHGLNLRQRLRLFAIVCLAVDAAHRALIVHRDLKPSNVLVTQEGDVKLLDFGIAKLLDEDEDGVVTQMPAFTPAYAAPEQRDGNPITTATDVYALGVMLGELITGERVNDGSGRTPSSWISGRATTASNPNANVPPIMRHQVRGDLDAIVLKALDAAPARRYASAGLFADDIERLLAGQPVSAHAASRWYHARKFVLRHKGAVAGTVAFLIAILAAFGVALWQARIAGEQARIARNESERANSTLGFVVDLLKTASADLPKDQRPTPEALVIEAAKNAGDAPDLDPHVRVQLLQTLGEIARTNGDNDTAEKLTDDAIARARALGVPTTSPQWIAAMVTKGNILHSTNRSREADRLMQRLLPEIAAVDSEGSVSALMLYGATRAYAGDRERAAAVAMQALAKGQRVFGADSIDALQTATYLGQLCSSLRRYREGAAILEEAIARWRRLKLPLDEQFARSLLHLAASKQHLGARAEVEPLFREALALMRSIRPGMFHRLSQGLVAYAHFLVDDERFDEAQIALDEAREIDREMNAPDNVRNAMTLNAYGRLHNARQDSRAAEAALRMAYATLSRHAKEAGYEHELARLRLDLGATLLTMGRVDEAATLQSQAMAELPANFGPETADIVDGLCVGGQIMLARADARGALSAADRALSMALSLDLPVARSDIQCRVLRANALLTTGRADDAAIEAQRAIDRQGEAFPEARAGLASLLSLRARSEQAQGRAEAAAATIAQANALGVLPALLSNEDMATLDVTP